MRPLLYSALPPNLESNFEIPKSIVPLENMEARPAWFQPKVFVNVL